jgi:hypothetical protein
VNDTATLFKHTQTKYNIHGEIIEYAVYEPNANRILKELKILKYNSQGLLVGIMVYNKDNALVWTEEYQYNNREQVTKSLQIDYMTAKPKKSYQTLAYDNAGRLLNSKSFNTNDVQIAEINKSYSDNGELLSSSEWSTNDNGDKASKKTIVIENQYNQIGQLTHSIRQQQLGKKKIKDIKIFENCAIVSWTKLENGKLVSHFENKQKDIVPEAKEYLIPPPIPAQENGELEYDDDKRDPLANIEHKAYRTVTRKTNKQGLLIKKIIREYNQVVEVIHYFYDEKDQLLRKRIFDKITTTEKEIRYRYDKHQNTVESKIYRNDSLAQKNVYNYEYYYQ